MNDRRPLFSRRLDRRAFLGGAGFAAGAVVATALVPLSIVHAVPAQESLALTPLPADPSWTGHVDDACGHWPPYSYDIPYNGVREPEAFAGSVHPADAFWMV